MHFEYVDNTCGDLSNGSASDGREMLKEPLLAPLVITPLQSDPF